jgi:UPF0755 protein
LVNIKAAKPWQLLVASATSVVVITSFGLLMWLMLSLRSADHDSTSVTTFALAPGTSAREVAEQLEMKGLIRSASAFTTYVTLTGRRAKLQAGTYEISPSDSAGTIVVMMTEGHVASNRLVVPDGVNILKLRQIAAGRGINLDQLDEALKATDYQEDFIKAKPAGTSLEGYLFPDSYEVVKPLRAKSLIQSMLDNFGRKVGATDVAQRYAAMGLSLHQGVTLASIVEKEVSSEEDRAMVAQVYINRLKVGMPLQADPTVQYAADINEQAFDVKLNSLYNTYVVKGLPPGPICNPSLSSMKAVAHPQANEYMYFIADKQGKTHYAKTFAEHQANVAKYLQ